MAPQLLITDILKTLKAQYLDLVSDATTFFREFEEIYLIYEKETQRTKEINKQIETILSFKEANGFYPAIKDQDDTGEYLKELKQLSATAQERLDYVEPKVLGGFRRRTALLTEMADTIIEQTLKDKDANRFITTMVLRAPLPNDQARCASNEKNKPLYIAALSVKLLQKLLETDQIIDEDIVKYVPKLNLKQVEEQTNQKSDATTNTSSDSTSSDSKDKSKKEEEEIPEEILEPYKRQVLRPIIFAALIHQIGAYSLDADKIYKGNRYRLLDEEERKKLINVIYKSSRNYLKYGVGEPDRSLFESMDADEYLQAVARYDLTDSILTNYVKPQHALGNLLRIPMIYASFLMSTKSRHNYNLIYKAYDIMKSGIDKEVIYEPYTKVFMKMVGRFPMGSGIYFVSKETNVVEKGVVVGLNPAHPKTAIVKQTTKRQVKYEDHSQTEVTYDFNIINPAARKQSDFSEDYYKKQYPNGFYWNPAEDWEMDINQKTFWRRDNSIRRN